ncbi:MAG: nitronate monooxygenase [Candidatus Helarchaeota archaeon]|nr:nitronate monooxygenase [Candidatus Helarchaeota archaeon]
MIKTRITEMFGVKYPIVLAGMGPFSTYKTAVKVGNSGGIGLTSHWGILSKVDPNTFEISDASDARSITPAQKIELDLKYIRDKTDDGAVCGCNIRVARVQADWKSVLRRVLKLRREDREMREKIKIIVTSAGNPAPPNKMIKKNNEKHNDDLKHFHVSPCLRLVEHTFKSGCDGVVAVGYEGGGHQSYEGVNTSVLIPIVRAHFPDKPIIAGGGFYNGQTLASGLALGADAVQMGTRFIATSDGDFHPNFKKLILKSQDEDTIITTGMFGPIRLIKNKHALEHAKVLTREEKIKQEKFQVDADQQKILQQQMLEKFMAMEKSYKGDVENGPCLGGQTVGGIESMPTVKELIETMMAECQETIKTLYFKIGE